MNLLIDLLATAAPTAAPGGTPGTGTPPPAWLQMLTSFGPIILIFGVLFFLMSSTKRKQERERNAMLAALKKNDKVQLVGGEVGSIVDVRPGHVLVKVDETSNTKILYVKDAVSKVLKDDKTDAAK